MKLNETRLAVAADLAKKLEKLHSAARIACSSLECRKMTFQQVKDDPGKAALRIRLMNDFYELMRSEFFDCCDLAADLVQSLESGTKCALVPADPKQTPTGSGADPAGNAGRC